LYFFCNLIFVFRPHRVGLAGRRHGASHHAQHADALDRAHEWGKDHSRPEHYNIIGLFNATNISQNVKIRITLKRNKTYFESQWF